MYPKLFISRAGQVRPCQRHIDAETWPRVTLLTVRRAGSEARRTWGSRHGWEVGSAHGFAQVSGKGWQAGSARLSAWRKAWAAAVAAEDGARVAELRRSLDELGLTPDDLEIELEMIAGLSELSALSRLRQAICRDRDRAPSGGVDICHFSAPASIPDDSAQPSGRMILTDNRAIFAGGGRAEHRLAQDRGDPANRSRCAPRPPRSRNGPPISVQQLRRSALRSRAVASSDAPGAPTNGRSIMPACRPSPAPLPPSSRSA